MPSERPGNSGKLSCFLSEPTSGNNSKGNSSAEREVRGGAASFHVYFPIPANNSKGNSGACQAIICVSPQQQRDVRGTVASFHVYFPIQPLATTRKATAVPSERSGEEQQVFMFTFQSLATTRKATAVPSDRSGKEQQSVHSVRFRVSILPPPQQTMSKHGRALFHGNSTRYRLDNQGG